MGGFLGGSGGRIHGDELSTDPKTAGSILAPMSHDSAMEPAIVRVRDLRDYGATDLEIRKTVRALKGVATGAYADTRDLTPEAEHRVRSKAVLQRLSWTVLSHISSAVTRDLPVPWPHLVLVHLSPLEGRAGNPRSRPGYHLHTRRVTSSEVEWVEGVAITNAIRTVIDCAATLPLDWAVAVADAALHRELILPEELSRAAGAQRRVKGAARMRCLPDLASRLAESPGESLTRMRLLRMGLAPVEQVSMPHVAGNPRVDFLIEGRLVIEFDGRGKYQLNGDVELAHWEEKLRHDRLVEAGYEVLHITWADLWDEAALRARVNRALMRARSRPAPVASWRD